MRGGHKGRGARDRGARRVRGRLQKGARKRQGQGGDATQHGRQGAEQRVLHGGAGGGCAGGPRVRRAADGRGKRSVRAGEGARGAEEGAHVRGR